MWGRKLSSLQNLFLVGWHHKRQPKILHKKWILRAFEVVPLIVTTMDLPASTSIIICLHLSKNMLEKNRNVKFVRLSGFNGIFKFMILILVYIGKELVKQNSWIVKILNVYKWSLHLDTNCIIFAITVFGKEEMMKLSRLTHAVKVTCQDSVFNVCLSEYRKLDFEF